jgi:hypothetical protein
MAETLMEPTGLPRRHNDVHVDTPALGTIATAQIRHAADLADAAARLAAVSPSTEAFGPVGARFLTALTEALAREARAATALGERLAAGGDLASTTATAYADSEQRAQHAVASAGV